MKDINCPYCGAEQYIDHVDGNGYGEDEKHQQQCSNCEKTFVYTTTISFYYDADKAECLNGGEHDFQPTHTSPREYTMMRCAMCDEERKPTNDEMSKILNT